VVRALWPVRWMTVAAPEYLARHGTPASPGELAGHDCLAFMLPSGRVQEWAFVGGSRAVRGNLVADHGESLVAAAIAGLGIVQAHDYMVAPEVARGRLVEVLRAHATEGPRVSLLCAPGRHRAPRVRAFIDFVDETLRRPAP
jgi:DNA-binding transcriptional LysR family regulator